jgi:hypothetical protein
VSGVFSIVVHGDYLNSFKNGYCNMSILFLSGVRLSPVGTAATTGLFYRTQVIDDRDCGVIG